MPASVVGVSLQPEALAALDELAAAAGLSRSAMIARLVEGEWARRSAGNAPVPPEVVVDGVRFLPAVER